MTQPNNGSNGHPKRFTRGDFAMHLGVSLRTIDNYREMGCKATTPDEMARWRENNIAPRPGQQHGRESHSVPPGYEHYSPMWRPMSDLAAAADQCQSVIDATVGEERERLQEDFDRYVKHCMWCLWLRLSKHRHYLTDDELHEESLERFGALGVD